MRRVTLPLTALVLVSLLLSSGLYYFTAWRVARTAVVRAALGEPVPGSLQPKGYAWDSLRDPSSDELAVETHAGWFAPSSELAFAFTVWNTRRGVSIAPVDIGVLVRFSWGGWEVIDYGLGG